MKKINYQTIWVSYEKEKFMTKAVIRLDLGLYEVVDKNQLPILLIVTQRSAYKNKSGSGLSNFQIEETYPLKCKESIDMVYVGQAENDKFIYHFYYLAVSFLEKLDEFIAGSNYDLIEDKNWDIYFKVLFPSEIELMYITNEIIVNHYLDNMKISTEKFKFKHWIYFNLYNDRDDFLDYAEKVDISVEDFGFEEKNNNYFVVVCHDGLFDKESINNMSYGLYHKAKKFNGIYDGWALCHD